MGAIVTKIVSGAVKWSNLTMLVTIVAVGIVFTDCHTNVVSNLRKPYYTANSWTEREAASIEVLVSVETTRTLRYTSICGI